MLVNQLKYYSSQLINEQKMFPHTHDTFCYALAYRMVFSMEKCLVFNLETKSKCKQMLHHTQFAFLLFYAVTPFTK